MIGIVGLGNMGRAIAERLEDTGAELIVWNRSPGKAGGLAAAVAATPAEVAGKADTIVSILGNDAATERVYFGPDGLLSTDLGGRVVIEMCTASSERAATLETAVEAQGGLFLECPVGGTTGPARAGKLLGLAGGSDAAFARAKPTLDQLCRRLEHIGPAGTGAAMKLAINLPLNVYWAALGEALGLAMARGVDPSLALDILADSSGAIGAARTRVPPIRDMVVSGDPGRTNMAIENMVKDLHLMVDAAAAGGTAHAVVGAVLARAEAAQADGYAGLDCALLASYGLLNQPIKKD